MDVRVDEELKELKYENIIIDKMTPRGRIYSGDVVDDMLRQYNERIANNNLIVDYMYEDESMIDEVFKVTNLRRAFGSVKSVKYDNGFIFDIKRFHMDDTGYEFYKHKLAHLELCNLADIADNRHDVEKIDVCKLSFIIRNTSSKPNDNNSEKILPIK